MMMIEHSELRIETLTLSEEFIGYSFVSFCLLWIWNLRYYGGILDVVADIGIFWIGNEPTSTRIYKLLCIEIFACCSLRVLIKCNLQYCELASLSKIVISHSETPIMRLKPQLSYLKITSNTSNLLHFGDFAQFFVVFSYSFHSIRLLLSFSPTFHLHSYDMYINLLLMMRQISEFDEL